MTRRFRKVSKDKKTGVAKKYLSGAKNKAAKAAEIKRTAAAYKRGAYIDINAVQKSRVAQDGSKSKTKKKTFKRGRKKALKRKADNSQFTYGQLAQVYRRGQGAYLGGGSRNVTMGAWAMGRVNSFVSGKGGARKADADLMKKK